MIEFRLEIKECKNGRVSIEARAHVSKETVTKLEADAAGKLRPIIEAIMEDLAKVMPGSALAKTDEDVETLRGLEDLDFKKEWE